MSIMLKKLKTSIKTRYYFACCWIEIDASYGLDFHWNTWLKFHWIWRNRFWIIISVLLLQSAGYHSVLLESCLGNVFILIFVCKTYFHFFPHFSLLGISRISIIFIWFFFLNFYSWCASLATWCFWSSING